MKLVDIIKYEGDNSTFVWKHPVEDFNSMTQLIVHESPEAIFFMNGEALDLFGPGRHTLETQNIPLLGKKLNKLTDGDSPFHCEVYFINKTVQMAIKWGTDSKIRYLDPNLGIPLEIGACGELNLAVSDSRKLLIKLVGTMRGIAWGDNGLGFTKSIQNCFRRVEIWMHLNFANGGSSARFLWTKEKLCELLNRRVLLRLKNTLFETGV